MDPTCSERVNDLHRHQQVSCKSIGLALMARPNERIRQWRSIRAISSCVASPCTQEITMINKVTKLVSGRESLPGERVVGVHDNSVFIGLDSFDPARHIVIEGTE